jgi:hypothetical protein
MDSNNRNRSVPFFRYFPRAIKFYGLKVEKIAALVFIVLLAINLAASLFSATIFDNLSISTNGIFTDDIAKTLDVYIRIMVLSLISFLISNIISAFYVYAYIRDLRGIPYTFGECMKNVAGKLIKIFLLSVIIALAITFGTVAFFIPGVILYIMFIFAVQFMLDQNRTVFNSLKASLNLTNGYKVGIFTAVLLLDLITMLVTSFVASSGGILVFSFVSAFITTIFNLIYQRFITLIYLDLEYIRKPKENIDINI